MRQVNHLRVVVIDDQPAIRKNVQALVGRYHEFNVVASCGSVQEALTVIPATNPDLILLDIQLGDGTGFDILDKIESKDIKVIFLTAYEQHAIRAIRMGALDYLMKPINENELRLALDKAIQSPSYPKEKLTAAKKYFTRPGSKILIPAQHQTQVIDTRSIVYCQGDSGVTKFFLADNKKIIASKCLKEFERKLPADPFLRIHKSYIINLDFIDHFSRDGVTLHNGVQIPIATRKKDLLLDKLNQYW